MDTPKQRQRTDVFLIFSEEDLSLAQMLVHALKHEGFSVWWDRGSIQIGMQLEEAIYAELTASACAVVLWTPHSRHNEQVLTEARYALQQNKLLPVIAAPTELPSEFMSIKAADLINWKPDDLADSRLQRLVQAIHYFVTTAPSSADQIRIYKENQRNVERRAESLLQRNLRSVSWVEHLSLEKTAFFDDLTWNFQPGVNVLLGRNGYGKTYLLRSLVALLQYREDAAIETLGDSSASVTISRDNRDETVQYAHHFFSEEQAVGQIPILAVPDTRFVNRSITTIGAVQDKASGKNDRADLARYGAWHFLNEQPYENMIQALLYGLCLDCVEAGGRFEGEQFVLIRDVVRELTDQTFAFDRVAREGRNSFTLYVRTEGNEQRTLPIQKASQGTASVIALMGLIYDFLKSLRQDVSTPVCERSGIVIVDEIDAHLHPLWQHKLVGLLRERFPHVQFILTAHNPIIVAGCLEDEVSVLRKNATRGFGLLQFPNDFIGWPSEKIYRQVFEVENSDASFTRYNALRPFKAQLEDEAATLTAKTTRSDKDEQTLESLEEQLRYIVKVEQAHKQHLTQEELECDNQMLRQRVQAMELVSKHPAQSETQVSELQTALRAAEERVLATERHSRSTLFRGVLLGLLLTLTAMLLIGILLVRN